MLNLIKIIHKDDLDSNFYLIENCNKTDARGANYLVGVTKEDSVELAKHLGCKDDRAIKDFQKRITLNQIGDMLLSALDSDEETLTAHLIQEYGDMDSVLMHYNLIERTEEEQRIDNIVSSGNFLKPELSDKHVNVDIVATPVETVSPRSFSDFTEEDGIDDSMEEDIVEDIIDDIIEEGIVEDTYVPKNEIEDVKSIFKSDLDEPMNAYTLQSNLDAEDDKTEVPNPYEFYNKEEEDLNMRYQEEVYMPPNMMNTNSDSNNDNTRIIIKGKSKDMEEKLEPVYEPQTTVSPYKKVKENQEIDNPSDDGLVRLNLMFKKICSKLNLDFAELESEVDKEIELLRNPNFSEEELQLAIGRLISSGLLSGMESEFYVKSFDSDPGTVTKILRGKLDKLKER